MRVVGRTRRGPTEALDWNWQLIAVKELGAATEIWLGVRDDFRNLAGHRGVTQTLTSDYFGLRFRRRPRMRSSPLVRINTFVYSSQHA